MSVRRLAPILLLPAVMVLSCLGPPANRPTTREVCHRMAECGGWGWQSEKECEKNLLRAGEYEAACQGRDGYLDCMAGCRDLPCDQFESCEFDCWDSQC